MQDPKGEKQSMSYPGVQPTNHKLSAWQDTASGATVASLSWVQPRAV